MASILGWAAALYLGVAAFLYLWQDRLLFFPDVPGRAVTATPADAGLPFEPVRIAASDGVELAGWWVPAPGAHAALIHFHGNAGNIGHRLELLTLLHALGHDVFMFDYRGYGESAGTPDEAGLYRDAEAVWAHVVKARGYAPHAVVLHGQSLGGGVAAWLAARVQPRALILESTFTSVPDLGAELYPWLPVRWLSRLGFDTRAQLAQVRAPVLVIHSRDDEIIPFAHGQRLFETAGSPKRMLEIRGDHNGGFWTSRDAYLRGLRDFLAAQSHSG